jgi:hypothetical protein
MAGTTNLIQHYLRLEGRIKKIPDAQRAAMNASKWEERTLHPEARPDESFV